MDTFPKVSLICETVARLLNHNINAAIMLHDVMHGFWAGCGTGTAALEAKMIQQTTAMREAVLFEVFLDFQKAYDSLDWDRCI